tara:strand:- start:722 stop:1192 length:471 start_codon:yes stop_codon:yes gene_type:complete
MRNTFADQLFEEMKINKDIYLIVGDVGYGVFDKFKEEFPDRFINPGASEQLMIGMASGLAMDGKISIVYSITPFILYRPFEFIRNIVNKENIPIKIVGSGRDEDYGALGFSHFATDDEDIISNFENIKIYKPQSSSDLNINEFLYNEKPSYLNLKR